MAVFQRFFPTTSGSFAGDGGGLTNINATTATSASYAITASYAMNGGGGGTTTGSFTGSFTGSLNGTASYALTASYVTTAQTASFVTTAQTASYVQNAQTASYVTTAQTASYVSQAVSSSYASTISYDSISGSVKNDVYFTIYFEHGNIAAPADATTYYFGALTNSTPSTSAQDRKVAWAFGDCTLIAATIGSRAGTGGTAGVNNALYFRLNDTTDTTLSTTISYSVTGTVQTYTATGLSTNIANGDFFEMKLVTGTWASNPVNIGTSGYLLFKRR